MFFKEIFNTSSLPSHGGHVESGKKKDLVSTLHRSLYRCWGGRLTFWWRSDYLVPRCSMLFCYVGWWSPSYSFTKNSVGGGAVLERGVNGGVEWFRGLEQKPLELDSFEPWRLMNIRMCRLRFDKIFVWLPLKMEENGSNLTWCIIFQLDGKKPPTRLMLLMMLQSGKTPWGRMSTCNEFGPSDRDKGPQNTTGRVLVCCRNKSSPTPDRSIHII